LRYLRLIFEYRFQTKHKQMTEADSLFVQQQQDQLGKVKNEEYSGVNHENYKRPSFF
jgi:hypothetical protein